ncbi:MAG: NADH-quinone oxidoreductase subunit K [Anaerolineaceae bacterium]|nr:NADH-quinone oxidoreductase subunit K [Anaerolineaceae bacterium]
MTLSISEIILITVILLLGIGFYGLLAVRNLIKVIVSLQIMVKGMMLGFVLAGRLAGNVSLGQSLAILVIVVDTIVAIIGLALAVQIRRYAGSLDVKALTTLKR